MAVAVLVAAALALAGLSRLTGRIARLRMRLPLRGGDLSAALRCALRLATWSVHLRLAVPAMAILLALTLARALSLPMTLALSVRVALAMRLSLAVVTLSLAVSMAM